ncbi:MAG: response regulator [Candidatus Vogelbacteria bacterium]
MKILIIDDDKFLLDMYSVKFSEQGFDLQSAGSAQEALDKISGDWRPDVYLVDIIMPTMDGFQLIEELKRRNLRAGSALIVLSNLGQKEDIEKALALGVDGYIVKASATPSEVVTKVTEIAQQLKSSPLPAAPKP